MTKGLACASCHDLRMLSRNNLEPLSCRCGNVTGWWLDGPRGVARYTATNRQTAFGVGFNNRFWLAALVAPERTSSTEWRQLHEDACEAPGYLFDKNRRNCWVVLFKPGTVGSVEWATNEELAALGMPPDIWNTV